MWGRLATCRRLSIGLPGPRDRARMGPSRMSTPQELPRRLNLIDAISIVVGIVIGAGIFLVPNLVAQSLPSAGAMLGVWVFAGIVSFFGALACAELGAAMPSTGGQYVFLRDIYGPLAGFVCGWSMFTVARTAQVAWLAVSLALYVSYFMPLSPLAIKAVALLALVVFTTINYLGVEAGARVQRGFTLAKVSGLAIIVVGAFFLSGGQHNPAAQPAPPIAIGAFGAAMIPCLLAFDGWVQVTFVAGEIKRPHRNVLLALAIGVAIVIVIYVLANASYLRVLSVKEIAASDHVGALAAERTFGPAGGKLVSLIILLSITGSLNGCFLTSPRIFFAQARDGLWFPKFAAVHPRYRTPYVAIAAQGIWSALLIVTGSYGTLVNYAMFAIWVFYGLMVAGLMILRYKQPGLPRPYRMWGYPVTPLLFLAVTGWFLWNTLITQPWPSLAGLAMMASGIPAYYVFRRWRRFRSLVVAPPAPAGRGMGDSGVC